MPTNINRLRLDEDCLFTTVENTVLAAWFGRTPTAAAARIELNDALKELGFETECFLYSQSDAAVAYILLEAVEDRLPVWVSWKNSELISARAHRAAYEKPRRIAALLPRKLFTINWASSGPGFDWPVWYNLIWVPVYDIYVVTASADCPDAYGYADFAIGHFASTDDVETAALKIIRRDWCRQRDEGQARWETLDETGLIKVAAVHQLADAVWRDEVDDIADNEDAPEDASAP
jgi:hypothetical protein